MYICINTLINKSLTQTPHLTQALCCHSMLPLSLENTYSGEVIVFLQQKHSTCYDDIGMNIDL